MARKMAIAAIVALLVAACSVADPSSTPALQDDSIAVDGDAFLGTLGAESHTRSFLLPTAEGKWTPPQGAPASDGPSGVGTVDIVGIGRFQFEASEVKTVRPDILRPGHFSLFDALVHIAGRGEIDLEYHFSEAMDTYLVDRIDGQSAWWYSAYYAGGWGEANVFRMDMFPYKDGITIRMQQRTPDELMSIYATFTAEAARLEEKEPSTRP